MAKPYSNDLRARVIEAIEEGATREEAAERHEVSLSSVGRFLRLKRERGASVRRNSAGTNRMSWQHMRIWSGHVGRTQGHAGEAEDQGRSNIDLSLPASSEADL
jgi:hypothetical protein